MSTLLVLTTGQTDVQLVINDRRHKLDGNTCGELHDEIREREWSIVAAPCARSRDFIKSLPEGRLDLCTPKLDALMAYFGDVPPTKALILETTRRDQRDPRMCGEILERRLYEKGAGSVKRVAFLSGDEALENQENPLDSVIRREVVTVLATAIASAVDGLGRNDRVFVATTGGLAAANDVINELVRLLSVGGPTVTALDVPDMVRSRQVDRAVEEKFHPASGHRARWHALALIDGGNFLGAWGAVNHLRGIPGQEWTEVVEWLANFAASLPIPPICEFPILRHRRSAVRTAIRVELALRAGDIPRAVHGSISFFEAALWDHLGERVERHPQKRMFWFRSAPDPVLVREADQRKLSQFSNTQRKENDRRPFELKETIDDRDWYRIDDSGMRGARIASEFLGMPHLGAYANVIESEPRNLRNVVAHSEPTPELMADARRIMRNTGLWSDSDTFLSQSLVQNVLRELGEPNPKELLITLLSTVRARVVDVSSH